MSQEPESTTAGAATNVPPAAPVELRPPAEKRRPTLPVPTERIAFPKQLDILRAYAAVSGIARRPVSLAEVSNVVQLNVATTSLANSFFLGVGLIGKQDAGFVPSAAVAEYHQNYEWDRGTATHFLAPVMRETWAWSAIQGQLGFSPQPDRELVRLLGQASHASTHYEQNFKLILAFFEAAGMIERDGGNYRLVRGQAAVAPPAGGAKTPIGNGTDERPTEEQQQSGREDEHRRGGGNFGGPPTVHPALVGLLSLLPPPRSSWGRGKQDWIKAFTATIDAIYPDGGDAKDGRDGAL